MNIFITGGAGFIGKYLAESFLEKNRVCIYDNLSNSSKNDISQLIKNGADFVRGDILDYEYLKKSCKGFDAVIHLAAISDVSNALLHPKRTDKVNVNGTINVLKCCVNNKIKKVVFSSSAAVYGDCKLPISEKSSTKPTSIYGTSKLKAEKQIREFSNRFGLNAVCLRLFNVYGTGQNNAAGVISKFLSSISKDNKVMIYGDGGQTRDFISVKDVTESFHCAIKKETASGDAYNIASGNSISINNLAELIASISNKKKIKINYKSENKYEIKFSRADITLAQKELGFNPKIKLDEGIRGLISVTY